MNENRKEGGTPILDVEDLSYSYVPGKAVFSDISFSLYPGDIFVILGANGAGKSTLLNCISGMLKPSHGKILIKGRPLEDYSTEEQAKIMGYVPQITIPTFSYTVRDYVVMGRAAYLGMFNVPGPKEYEIADRCLEEMNIRYLSDKMYDQISGGERQQVEIVRVLVQEAPLILLDEPTNHLDYGNQLKIIKVISQLAKSGLCVVLTTHMPDHAILLDGIVGLLNEEGRLLVGPAGEVITEQRLKELYKTDLHLVYIDELGRTACVAGRIH